MDSGGARAWALETMTRSADEERREARRERKRAFARDVEVFRERIGDSTPMAMAPQALHHWDHGDQIDELVEARDGEPDIGFMMRLLALCTLPRTNPGDRQQYRRENGPYTLYLLAGGDEKLPYGTLPRLLLAWVCTEAVRTQSRTLVLGRSLAEFMRALGIQSSDSGGRWGVRTRLRNQMSRLFGTSVQLLYETKHRTQRVTGPIASGTDLWWDPKRPDEPVLWESTIRLGEDFFNEIVACPVPLDMRILRAMKRSAIGLDLYLWLTYRLFSLDRPLRLTWRQLYRQFGAHPAKTDKVTVLAFRRKVLRELVKLKIAWQDLDYATPRGHLELRPTRARIPPAIFTDQV